MSTSDRTRQMNSMWLKIPKLKDMAWEAVNQYNPKLNQVRINIRV